MRSNLLFTLTLLFSSACFAGSQSGSIQKLAVSGRDYAPPHQNPSHVYLAGEGEYSERPACASSGYWAINTDTEQGKAMLSLLLAAYATGRPVTLWGTGYCNLRPDMETLFQIGLDNEL